MSGTPECGGDAAAYALGALEPQEADAFRRHMRECAVCRDEVEALGGVVQALPLAVRQYELPGGVRRAVMRDVRRDVARGRRRRLAVWPGLLRERLAVGAVGLAAAAGGVVAVVGVGGGAAVTIVQASLSGVSGDAQLRVAGGRAELLVRHLTPPGAGHVYEVWLQSGHTAPVPASVLFGVNAAGNADVGIPRRIRRGSAVLVTPEPLGGTSQPTHTPVITARLT
ncbi:MAG TPA: anti-sigma factor [Solirubrobacteraceae bacterium]|nr:anti-sigma factor [Solirubrobacteraceae bacterium]